MSWADWLRLLALSLLWGVSFFFVELAIPSFAPFTLVFVRVSIAALLMLFILRGDKLWAIVVQRWRIYAFIGVFGSALPFFCFAWGQRYITSSVASVMNSLTPLFIFIFSVFLGREQFDIMRAIGIVMAFAGVTVLLDADFSAAQLGGTVLAFAAAVSYGIASTYAWGRVRHYPPIENAFGQLLFAALFLLPLALMEQPWRADFGLVPVAAVLVLAAFSTFAAYLLYYRLLSSSGAVNAMLSTLLIPVFAVILGVNLLGEKTGVEFFIGMAMIFIGLIFTDVKLRQALKNVLRLIVKN